MSIATIVRIGPSAYQGEDATDGFEHVQVGTPGEAQARIARADGQVVVLVPSGASIDGAALEDLVESARTNVACLVRAADPEDAQIVLQREIGSDLACGYLFCGRSPLATIRRNLTYSPVFGPDLVGDDLWIDLARRFVARGRIGPIKRFPRHHLSVKAVEVRGQAGVIPAMVSDEAIASWEDRETELSRTLIRELDEPGRDPLATIRRIEAIFRLVREAVPSRAHLEFLTTATSAPPRSLAS